MANIAKYVMVIKGTDDCIRKFIDEAKPNQRLFYADEDINISIEKEKAVISCGAAWSVASSTKIDWNKDTDDYSNSWLVQKSKDYNLSIRYRAYEPLCGFTEDFEVINGEVTLDESVDTRRNKKSWVEKIIK